MCRMLVITPVFVCSTSNDKCSWMFLDAKSCDLCQFSTMLFNHIHAFCFAIFTIDSFKTRFHIYFQRNYVFFLNRAIFRFQVKIKDALHIFSFSFYAFNSILTNFICCFLMNYKCQCFFSHRIYMKNVFYLHATCCQCKRLFQK